jgi:hypothetical protein
MKNKKELTGVIYKHHWNVRPNQKQMLTLIDVNPKGKCLTRNMHNQIGLLLSYCQLVGRRL